MGSDVGWAGWRAFRFSCFGHQSRFDRPVFGWPENGHFCSFSISTLTSDLILVPSSEFLVLCSEFKQLRLPADPVAIAPGWRQRRLPHDRTHQIGILAGL